MSDTFWFDVPSLYYIPQYQPVLEELQKRGHQVQLLLHEQNAQHDLIEKFCQETSLPWYKISSDKIVDFYNSQNPDWIIFGNSFSQLNQLNKGIKTALLYHGIGIKACYYDPELAEFDIRFTEGEFRQKQLQQLYPQANFIQTGFAKLDPLAKSNAPYRNAFDLKANHLSADKPTLLYAPTFYPSSIECMPLNWPELFNDCNIIIKPHLISYTHEKYKAQRERFKVWERYSNVYLAPAEEISLLPYMATADLLISEASSALFEFAALDKPVVWLDFLKLRWSYRGIFSYRFKKRMDQTIHQYSNIAAHAEKPRQLEKVIRQELKEPGNYQAQRKEATDELIGTVDGQASKRIVNVLLKHAG